MTFEVQLRVRNNIVFISLCLTEVPRGRVDI